MFYFKPAPRLRTLTAGWVALGAICLSSCSLRTGEAPPEMMPIKLGSSSLSCIEDSRAIWKRYYAGQASDGEIDTFWNCVGANIETIKLRLQGRDYGQLSYAELHTFVKRFFLNDNKITDTLLKEIFNLKVALVGGFPDRITFAELDRFKSFFTSLGQLLKKYKGLFPYRYEELIQGSRVDMLAHFQKVRSALSEFGDIISVSAQPYSRDRIFSLLLEVQRSVPEFNMEPVLSQADLLFAFKAWVVESNYAGILREDWKPVMQSLADVYLVFLDSRRFARAPGVWARGEKLRELDPLLSDVVQFLKNIVTRQPSKNLSFAKIQLAIDSMRPEDLPLGASASVLKDFVRPMIQRYLGGTEDGITGQAARGLTISALDRLYSEGRLWLSEQGLLDQVYVHLERQHGISLKTSYEFLSSEFPKAEILALLEDRDFADSMRADTGYSTEYQDRVLANVVAWVRDSNSLFRGVTESDPGAEIYFDMKDTQEILSFHNQSELHWMREIAQLSIQAYAHDSKRRLERIGLTLSEMQEFIADLVPIGIDLRWVDPTTVDHIHSNRFREANLFTFVGNGNDLVEAGELMQVTAMLASGGALATRVHSKMIASCPTIDANLYNYPMAEIRCYRKVYKENMPWILKNLPGLLEFYNGLSDSRKDEFIDQSARGSALDFHSPLMPYIGEADTQTMAVMYQYVEVLFKRFDQGPKLSDASLPLQRDGTFDTAEADQMFVVFEQELAHLTGVSSRYFLLGGFHWLLKKGKSGKTTNLSFLGWELAQPWKYLSWSRYHADPIRVFQVFGGILEKAGVTLPAPPAIQH